MRYVPFALRRRKPVLHRDEVAPPREAGWRADTVRDCAAQHDRAKRLVQRLFPSVLGKSRWPRTGATGAPFATET